MPWSTIPVRLFHILAFFYRYKDVKNYLHLFIMLLAPFQALAGSDDLIFGELVRSFCQRFNKPQVHDGFEVFLNKKSYPWVENKSRVFQLGKGSDAKVYRIIPEDPSRLAYLVKQFEDSIAQEHLDMLQEMNSVFQKAGIDEIEVRVPEFINETALRFDDVKGVDPFLLTLDQKDSPELQKMVQIVTKKFERVEKKLNDYYEDKTITTIENKNTRLVRFFSNLYTIKEEFYMHFPNLIYSPKSQKLIITDPY